MVPTPPPIKRRKKQRMRQAVNTIRQLNLNIMIRISPTHRLLRTFQRPKRLLNRPNCSIAPTRRNANNNRVSNSSLSER